MRSSIFSRYSTGENRVTASILAVVQSLSLRRIERLLGALMEQPEFELVRFNNQPKGISTTPDAMIVSSVRLLVETKVERNAVSSKQLLGHLKLLDGQAEEECKLLLLTPDDTRPGGLEVIGDSRLVWASFASLDQAIDEMLTDKNEVVSEREAFLLRELQLMLMSEGLLGPAKDVVVVAARNAWPRYEQFSAYVCQPNRPFQAVTRIAFYASKQICLLVPKICERHDSLELQRGKYVGPLGAFVDRFLEVYPHREGDIQKVMILSSPESPETLRLEAPIVNDLTSEAGRPIAFTQSQRYVSESKLKEAATTSALL